MKKWKYKLLAATGLVYPVASLPFILGLFTPSIHEGNLYSTLFVLLHIPVIFLLRDMPDIITERLFSDITLYNSNMIFLLVSYVFWIVLAFLVGAVVDRVSSGNKS